MKKFIATLLVALFASTAAFAQHAGQGGIGVNLGVAPCIEKDVNITNFELGVRGQYSFTDLFRGVLDLNYGFPDKSVSSFTAVANINCMIPLSTNAYIYPLAGLGVGNARVAYGGLSWNNTKFVFNIGVGAEYEFTSNISAGLEFKYQYMKDFGRLPIGLNVSYKF